MAQACPCRPRTGLPKNGAFIHGPPRAGRTSGNRSRRPPAASQDGPGPGAVRRKLCRDRTVPPSFKIEGIAQNEGEKIDACPITLRSPPTGCATDTRRPESSAIARPLPVTVSIGAQGFERQPLRWCALAVWANGGRPAPCILGQIEMAMPFHGVHQRGKQRLETFAADPVRRLPQHNQGLAHSIVVHAWREPSRCTIMPGSARRGRLRPCACKVSPSACSVRRIQTLRGLEAF